MTLATRSGPRASLARVWAVAERHYYVLKRSPHRFFDISVWPLVDTLLFGSIGVYFAQSGGASVAATSAAYLLVGIVLWHVVYQAQIALSTGFMEETWSRNLLSLMVTPLREWEYAAGVALFGLVKLVIGVGGVVVLAWAAYAFDITTLGLALVPIAAILLAVGWVVALFVIALVLRFGSGAEALAWGILFAVMPLSGVFYPVDALPGVLQPVAAVLPPTHAFAAGRALLHDTGMPWRELWLAGLTTLVAAAAAVCFLAWMLRVFRSRGYITRYL